jgi:hypothetical protein
LETKILIADKKIQDKQTRWQAIREYDMCEATIEEKSAMAELIAEENKTMMVDPTTMDVFTRESVGFDKDGDLATKKASRKWRWSCKWWWCSG